MSYAVFMKTQFVFSGLPDEYDSLEAIRRIHAVLDDESLFSFEQLLLIAIILRELQLKLDSGDSLCYSNQG